MSRLQVTTKTFTPGEITQLQLPEAEVYYCSEVFSPKESKRLFQDLQLLDGWQARPIRVFNRDCRQNRKTLYFGEKGTNYRYSGIDNPGNGNIPEVIKKITTRVTDLVRSKGLLVGDQAFNYWLGNLYENGSHTIGMHSDDEKGLCGPIASLSFGSPRFFDLKHKKNGKNRIRLNLQSGSLLIMAGDTQRNYLHGVPTQKKITEPRINLTLRIVETIT